MLDIHKVSVYFSGKYLFKEISFRLVAGDRIGLVGKNGAGKSTLLKLICGDESYESGTISYSKETEIALLRQDLDFANDGNLWQECEKAFEKINQLEKSVAKWSEELSHREDYESEDYAKLISKINDGNDRLNFLGIHQKDAQIAKILEGLGFTEKDWTKPTTEFSGGWRMRIELAKLLLQQPHILLLDEPTNHLDIDSIVWLEKFLKNYPGAVILVSHDKTFLNQVCNRTVEIQHGTLYAYKGNYDKYIQQRELLLEQQLAAFENQAKEKKRLEALVEKFRYKSSKAAFAQTLIKKLDKMEDISIDELDQKTMRFKFPDAPHSGKVVLKMEEVGKSFGTKKIFSKVNFELERGQKVAFVGQNGQGKTTLVKCIMQEWEDYRGKLDLGHQVEIGYFAQDQAKKLDTTKTVLDTVLDEANAETRPKVRGLLGSFLFEGEDVEKKVSVLSGGERGRLALCLLLLKPHNLLILDEPTNHLDIQSKEILKQAVEDYQGSVILISHDREFLEGLTDKVLEFREGKVKEILGGVKEYLELRSFDDFRQVEQQIKEAEVQENTSSKGQNDWKLEKEKKKIKNKINKLEKEINELESKIEQMQNEMAEDSFYSQPIEDQTKFIQEVKDREKILNDKLEEWEELSLEIDD
ncbi:MAG: ATP-binding cassette domain-containing protein [Flavobacteriales bacterium]|nr:ATP-binding cassette domain-containing protein [Flavobacteriales bacterium]